LEPAGLPELATARLTWQPDATGTYATAPAQASAELKASLRAAFLRAGEEPRFGLGVCPVAAVEAIFFDMDATAILEESLVEIARLADLGVEVERITRRAMAGELDFQAALRARVALLAGRDATLLDEVRARLTPAPGLREIVSAARQRGLPVFLVSGGFHELADEFGRAVGFTSVHANRFGIADGKFTGEVVGPIVDAEGKRAWVERLCAKHRLDPARVAAVGDGANDLPMLQAVGVAVGFCPKRVLWPHLDALNATGDHRFLGPLLFGASWP
jgi:phosphoserine phosphatase